MNSSVIGRIFCKFYTRIPMRNWWLSRLTKYEGGQISSVSLRNVLAQYHDVSVGRYSYGSLLEPGRADRQTQIGSYVSIGPDVRRFGAAHPIDEVSMHPFWYNSKFGFVDRAMDVKRSSITIGNDVWIGAGSIILPNCQAIGDGAVIGAGSVVTCDVEPYSVVAGNPARVIRQRLTTQKTSYIANRELWSMEPAELYSEIQKMKKSSF